MMQVSKVSFLNVWALPSELFCECILSYLALRDVGRLDSAVLERSLRVQFLEKLKNYEFSNFCELNTLEIEWIISKQLYIKNISFGRNLSDELLSQLGDRLERATSLVYSKCVKLNHMTIGTIAQYPSRLLHLSLDSCNHINDAAISLITRTHRGLLSVDVQFCMISETGLAEILTNCTSLETLNLSGCRLAVNKTFESLPWKNCSSLTSLNVGRIASLSDLVVDTISENLPQLRTLDLSWCGNISAHALIRMTRSLIALEVLILELVVFTTNDVILSIAQNCHKLRELNLNYLTKISFSSLVHLFQECIELQSIQLDHCTGVNDTAMISLAQHCSKLKKLNVTACHTLSDTAIDQIAQRCPLLSDLNVAECSQLTNNSIDAIAKHCVNLTNLAIPVCRLITCESLQQLPSHCKVLHIFDGTSPADYV